MMTSLVILGASGSIGSQTIDILLKNREDFTLLGISIGHKTRKIKGIVDKFPSIKMICIQDKNKVNYFSKHYQNIKFTSGEDGLLELIEYCKPNMVVNALVGFVGLKPSIYTLENDIDLALANKEALVVGGVLINKLLKTSKGKLYPIDSEHSALWKCLKVSNQEVEKLIITASGGAFRDLSRKDLINVTPEDALKHPTWRMGNKITIDCATMVNKSFEIIEAYYLFGYGYDQIDVLLHKESMIHSMVKYIDGTYRAEINHPDMRNPIKFALYKGCIPFDTYVGSDYHHFGDYHFKEFSLERYPMVKNAEIVINQKGTYGAVYNASNEAAVRAFLDHRIPFLAIESIIDKCMKDHANIKNPTYKNLRETHEKTMQKVNEMIERGEY